jgi:uracil phosphoribosyltransferase
MKINLLQHPLATQLLTLLRDKESSPQIFRDAVKRLSVWLAIEATRDLKLKTSKISTPVSEWEGGVIGESLALIPILRAGLGMSDAIIDWLPFAQINHLGFYRDEKTLQPVPYYEKLNASPPQNCFVLDPMLATGGTAVAAVHAMKKWGVGNICFIGLLGAPEGAENLLKAHPDVTIFLADLDEQLNNKGYIVPGLGDAGDRQYNTF